MAKTYIGEDGKMYAHGRGIKRGNCYAAQIRGYDKIPKAVLAAIAVSYASGGGDWLENASDNVLNEWRILYNNGIVPQRPPAGCG
jgi:hypothetical protein